MKIVSYNLNGIRSATAKGLAEWLKDNSTDIFCFQETRASKEQIDECIKDTNFHAFYNIADKKGYSGTAILSKQEPICERKDIFTSVEPKNEGRIIVLEYQTFVLINVYVPNGIRLEVKMKFLTEFLTDLKLFMATEKKPVIICSDFNIAHTEKDLSNPKECSRLSGYLPIERAMFDDYMSVGFNDSYRINHPDEQIFTWSSYTAKKLNNNYGYRYRFDYIFISNSVLPYLIDSSVLFNKCYSDHYPVQIILSSQL